MAGHGAQKLFGMFGGDGLTATGAWLAATGYRPGKVYAVIGGGSEFLGASDWLWDCSRHWQRLP